MYITLLSKRYCHSFSIYLEIIVKTTSERPKFYFLLENKLCLGLVWAASDGFFQRMNQALIIVWQNQLFITALFLINIQITLERKVEDQVKQICDIYNISLQPQEFKYFPISWLSPTHKFGCPFPQTQGSQWWMHSLDIILYFCISMHLQHNSFTYSYRSILYLCMCLQEYFAVKSIKNKSVSNEKD